MLDLIQTVLDFIANSRVVEFIQSVLENFGLSSSAVTPEVPEVPEPETAPMTPLEPATPILPDAPEFESTPGAATDAEDPRLN